LRTKPFPPWKAEARHGGQHGGNGQAREVTEKYAASPFARKLHDSVDSFCAA
jgi:hypothetical protein